MNEISAQRRDWQRKPLTASRGRRGQQHRQNGSGNAQAKYERYVALAREAAAAGDVVEMENCYQHAEHYFRVMRAAGKGQ